MLRVLALRARSALRAQRALRADRAQLGQRAPQGFQVPQVQLAQQGCLGLRAQPVLKVLRVCRGPQVPQGLQDLQVRLGLLVPRPQLLDPQAPPGTQGQLAPKVSPELKETSDPREFLDLQAQLVRLAQSVTKAPRGQPEKTQL